VAGHQEKACTEGRVIFLADESGLSQRPHRVRTWAPRGQTPVLQYCFKWKSLSAAAGLTAWNFYFRIYPGAIESPQVIDFLKATVKAILPQFCWSGTGCRRIAAAWWGTTSPRWRVAYTGVSGALRAGTQSGRIHLGLLEATRIAQRSPERLLATEPCRPPHPWSHAPPTALDHRLLDAGFSMARMTLYYARLK
jgi:hypothetical protein